MGLGPENTQFFSSSSSISSKCHRNDILSESHAPPVKYVLQHAPIWSPNSLT